MKLLILTQVVDKHDSILGFFHGWILELAKNFSEVHVICLQAGTYSFPDHIHVHSLGKETGENRFKYLWRFYRSFSHIFFTVRVTYIFFHMGAIFTVLAAPFFLLRRITKTKFLWWKAHGHLNWFGRLAFCFVDEVITSTASGFPIASTKRRIIGQAIDTDLFTTDPATTPDPKAVIFAGRVMPVKQLEVFIAVARALEPKGYTFTIVGPGSGAYYDGLQQEAADTNINWISGVDQQALVRHYQQSSIFLNSSLTHSLDKTVLEGILCGVLPLTANRAFRTLLEPHGLWLEEQAPERYITLINGLASMSEVSTRAALRQDVIAAHSLNTFSERVFSDYTSPYEKAT